MFQGLRDTATTLVRDDLPAAPKGAVTQLVVVLGRDRAAVSASRHLLEGLDEAAIGRGARGPARPAPPPRTASRSTARRSSVLLDGDVVEMGSTLFMVRVAPPARDAIPDQKRHR